MLLDFNRTKKILSDYKIPFCQTEIFKSKDKAVIFAEKIGYPVVLKISSQNIIHKIEMGGVKIGINNKEDFGKAWDEMLNNKGIKGKVEGFLVQKQVKGIEVIIGVKKDAQFGPVLMFGLGGTFVEVFKDVSFRVAPIGLREAKEMIKEIKGYEVFEGYRGREVVDTEKIAGIIVNLSSLSLARREIKEIDFNPVITNGKESLVCDAKIII